MKSFDKNRVISDVLEHSGKHVHPRLILNEADFERIRTTDDPVYNAAKACAIEWADEFLETEPLEYNIPDGIRLLDVSRGVLRRVKNLAMAYKITGDERYAERTWREMAKAASFKDWNPYHHLDVGEMTFALALGYDWIYDYMTAEQRRVIRHAIVKNGLLATMDDYLDNERSRSYRWYQDMPGDNWKFVCNGGATAGALAICDEDDIDKQLLTDVFGYAYENTYRAVRDMYLPDGSYSEGFTYWNYASDYLGYYISSLKSAAGTDYGLADYEPVKTSAYYVKYMCSPTFYSFNFGDAWETFTCPEVMFWIGKNFGKADITTMRKEEIIKDPSKARVRDLFWYVPTESVALEGKALGFGSIGGDNASFRDGLDVDAFYAAIHFGDNDAYHAHLDMGNFVVEWKKQRFLCDLGQDNYNVKNYRHAYRYRAEGHNTLVINPGDGLDQERQSICRVERFSDGADGKSAYAISDISATYPGKKVVRGIMMSEDKKWVVVRDELGLDTADTGWWFAHTRGAVTLTDGGKSAVIEQAGEKLFLTVLGEGVFTVMDAKHLNEAHYQPDQYDNSEYRKLAISFDGSAKEITVAIAPMVNGERPEELPEARELAAW